MDEQQLLENLGQPEYVMEAPDTTGEKDTDRIRMETEGYQGEEKIFLYANSAELCDLSKRMTSTLMPITDSSTIAK